MGHLILRIISRLHVVLYKASGGRVGGHLGKTAAPVLLLTTTGRKSGKRRTTPLLYLKDGHRYVIVASVGGAPKHPAWYLNLLSNSEAAIRIGRQKLAVTAETAAPDERTRLWSAVTQMYAGYDAYQAKTSREIPVVILKPKP